MLLLMNGFSTALHLCCSRLIKCDGHGGNEISICLRVLFVPLPNSSFMGELDPQIESA